MKRVLKYLLICLSVFYSFLLIAQDTPEQIARDSVQSKRFYIKINPLRYLSDEASIFIEHKGEKSVSYELKLGVIVKNYSLHDGTTFLIGPNTFFLHNGVLAGLGVKKTNMFSSKSFIQTSFIYKYKYAENEEVRNGRIGYYNSYWVYVTQFLRQGVINVIIGMEIWDKTKLLLIEPYVGFGMVVTYAQTNYLNRRFPSSPVPDREKPYYDNGWYALPTIHLGVKIGLGIGKK